MSNDDESKATGPESSERTIFDGFEAYLSVTDGQYRQLFENGLIVIDTNAIHNLYRYAEQTRKDFIVALQAVKSQLWVPQQVLIEFWRNRDSVMRDQTTSPREVIKYAEETIDSMFEKIDKWAKRISLDEKERASLKERYKAGIDELVQLLRSHGREESKISRDTNVDPLLVDLGELLSGRVGSPLSNDEREGAEAEGRRRVENKLPPAYMDANKPMDRAIGDYLVWYGILQEAKKRGSDVLFVTGDTKEDWWRIDGGQIKGPRVELFNEMKDTAGVNLVMLRPDGFLYHAQRLLAVDVELDSIRDVKRIDERLSENLKGWTIHRSSSHESQDHIATYINYLTELGASLMELVEVGGKKVYLFDYEGVYPLLASVSRGSTIHDVYEVSEILREAAMEFDSIEGVTRVLVTPPPSRESSIAAVLASGAIPVWRSGDFWWSVRRGVEKGLATERFPISSSALKKGMHEYQSTAGPLMSDNVGSGDESDDDT